MFIYASGRRSGKTRKMIEWFLGDPQNRVIITPNVAQANYIIRSIKPFMGSDFPFYNHIYPYWDANQMLSSSHAKEVGIDNLDMLLINLISAPVVFATVTGVKVDAPVRPRPWWRFWG